MKQLSNCPRDCPNRKPYCHNDDCDIWMRFKQKHAKTIANRNKESFINAAVAECLEHNMKVLGYRKNK